MSIPSNLPPGVSRIPHEPDECPTCSAEADRGHVCPTAFQVGDTVWIGEDGPEHMALVKTWTSGRVGFVQLDAGAIFEIPESAFLVGSWKAYRRCRICGDTFIPVGTTQELTGSACGECEERAVIDFDHAQGQMYDDLRASEVDR